MKNANSTKESLIKFQLGSTERKRLNKLEEITKQKPSELFRDALFFYMQFRYPDSMVVELDD